MKTEFFYQVNEQGIVNESAVIKKLQQEPGRYKVTVDTWNKRSLPQNSYLHGVLLHVVKDALRDAGWNHIRTIEDAKDFIKVKFLCKEVVNEQTGEIIQTFRNTSGLSRVEFAQLVEEVAVWLWEFFHIKLPMPGEQTEMPFILAADIRSTNKKYHYHEKRNWRSSIRKHEDG